jgi:hypothetical protein
VSVSGSKGAFICGQCPIRVVVEAPANERGDKDKFVFEISMSQKLDVLIKQFCFDNRLDPERSVRKIMIPIHENEKMLDVRRHCAVR